MTQTDESVLRGLTSVELNGACVMPSHNGAGWFMTAFINGREKAVSGTHRTPEAAFEELVNSDVAVMPTKAARKGK